VHTLWEKAIRFRHPDYDPDRAQKLISSSMSRHLSTRNISTKSMRAFLSNLANRQCYSFVAITGDRAFAVAGPRVWNSLPPAIRDPSLSPSVFGKLLKTYLFV